LSQGAAGSWRDLISAAVIVRSMLGSRGCDLLLEARDRRVGETGENVSKPSLRIVELRAVSRLRSY
jgi:hypothetical protein